jgi:hypothetical protein
MIRLPGSPSVPHTATSKTVHWHEAGRRSNQPLWARLNEVLPCALQFSSLLFSSQDCTVRGVFYRHLTCAAARAERWTQVIGRCLPSVHEPAEILALSLEELIAFWPKGFQDTIIRTGSGPPGGAFLLLKVFSSCSEKYFGLFCQLPQPQHGLLALFLSPQTRATRQQAWTPRTPLRIVRRVRPQPRPPPQAPLTTAGLNSPLVPLQLRRRRHPLPKK